jgi:hypothetical protein
VLWWLKAARRGPWAAAGAAGSGRGSRARRRIDPAQPASCSERSWRDVVRGAGGALMARLSCRRRSPLRLRGPPRLPLRPPARRRWSLSTCAPSPATVQLDAQCSPSLGPGRGGDSCAARRWTCPCTPRVRAGGLPRAGLLRLFLDPEENRL